MSQFGDTVTLVNRTKETRSCQWDGAHYQFESGEHQNVPLPVAVAAYRQNPLHGSEDPLGDELAFESLFGIKEAKEPYNAISPVTQSNAGERLNRSLIAGDGAKAVRRNAGATNRADARMGSERSDMSVEAMTK